MAITTGTVLAVQLAIGAIVLPATLVLGIFAIRKVKRQGDRVRKGFVWFHTALWILLFGWLMSLVAVALRLSYYQGTALAYSAESLRRIDSVVNMFLILGDAALLVSISELAAGARLASKQSRSMIFRIFIYVLAAISALLTIVYFGLQQHQISELYAVRFRTSSSIGSVVISWIGAAAIIVLIAGSLAVFIFALVTRHTTHKYAGGMYGPTGNLLTGIAALNFVVLIWVLIVALVVGLVYRADYAALAIADRVISRWGTFVILVLIYVLGQRQAGGLWSTPATKGESMQHTTDPISHV